MHVHNTPCMLLYCIQTSMAVANVATAYHHIVSYIAGYISILVL